MDSGFYRGTNSEQDGRFTDKEKKLLKTMKFESVLDTKVNLSKVNMEVIKPWITGKLNELMGSEDDVLVEYVFTQLEEKNVNPKVMQINLTGFLNAKLSREFMAELWQMFIDAQASPDGIPTSIVDKKMQELKMASEAKAKSGRDAGRSGRDGEKSSANESSMSKATESDWNNRYQSLTGGRYGKDNSFVAEGNGQSRSSPTVARREYDRNGDRGNARRDRDRSRERQRDRSRDRQRERDRDAHRDRDRSRERARGDGDRDRDVERDRERSRNRDRSRDRGDRRASGYDRPAASGDGFRGAEREKSSRRRSRTPTARSSSPSPPPRRRFMEESVAVAPSNDENSGTDKWKEEDEEAYEQDFKSQKVSSKVVVRKYSEDEKNEKEKSADEDAESVEEEKHKSKRKRKKERRYSSDSEIEHKKSKKHKKEKRKKRDKDRD